MRSSIPPKWKAHAGSVSAQLMVKSYVALRFIRQMVYQFFEVVAQIAQIITLHPGGSACHPLPSTFARQRARVVSDPPRQWTNHRWSATRQDNVKNLHAVERTEVVVSH